MHPKNKADERAISEGCYFDESIPLHVKKFAETFCKIEDKPDDKFEFHEWQWQNVVKPLYGWRTPTGLNRFTRGSCWCPRKLCKSTTLSAIILYELFRVPSAQVYLVSSSIESASQIFRMAVYSIENGPLSTLLEGGRNRQLSINNNTKVIRYKNSFIKVLSGGKKGRSGQGATCVIFDETAEIDSEESWHRLYNSSRARRKDSPIWFSISSPQYTVFPLAWQQYCKARAILNSEDDDPSYLAAIAQVPEDCSTWDQPETWLKYLPNVPSVVSLETLKQEYEQAKISPRDLARFRNHSLGQWCMDSADLWLPYDTLDQCFHDFNDNDPILQNQQVIIGIDAGLTQLAAYSLFFTESKHLIIRYFMPKESAIKSDNQAGTNYLAQEKEHLTLTEGDIFDWQKMKEQMQEDLLKFEVVEIGFDEFGLEGRMSELAQGLDCNVYPVAPYKRFVARPTRHLERLILAKDLKIQSNPLSIEHFRNARVTEDAHENIVLDRKKAKGRYDGVAATVLALARFLNREDRYNVYDKTELMEF